MKPTRDNIIVERIVKEAATASGIILKSSDEPDKAKVLSIGNKVDEVFINDVVLINWNKATKIEKEIFVVPVTEVVWIY
jgi:co-chaperonin GroES (HSP10)